MYIYSGMLARPHPLDYAVIKRFVRCSIRQPCSLGRLSCWGVQSDALYTITHDTHTYTHKPTIHRHVKCAGQTGVAVSLPARDLHSTWVLCTRHSNGHQLLCRYMHWMTSVCYLQEI